MSGRSQRALFMGAEMRAYRGKGQAVRTDFSGVRSTLVLEGRDLTKSLSGVGTRRDW